VVFFLFFSVAFSPFLGYNITKGKTLRSAVSEFTRYRETVLFQQGGYFFMVIVIDFASFHMVKSSLISFPTSLTPFRVVANRRLPLA